MKTLPLTLPHDEIKRFCQQWQVTEFALFGSVLRDDFSPNSDIDVLVSFSSEARWSLFDLVKMEDDLREIFGREVDLVERKALEQSPNYIRRKSILNNPEVIYAQG